MSWLRLDDDFAQHPKFAGWTVRDRWSWLQVMLYCARYRTGGRIPSDLGGAMGWPPKRARRVVEVATKSNLINIDSSGEMVIHDWRKYNPSDPTGASRQAKFRASRNARVTDTVTPQVTGGVTGGVTVPPARARPVPKERYIYRSQEQDMDRGAAASTDSWQPARGHSDPAAAIAAAIRNGAVTDSVTLEAEIAACPQLSDGEQAKLRAALAASTGDEAAE